VFVGCRLADPRDVTGSGFSPEAGAAKATYEEALCAALGEAVERYAASCVPETQLVLASAEDLDGGAIAPGRFALFRDDQYDDPSFPFQRFTETTPVRWVEAASLTGAPCWVPAQLVYLSDREFADEPRIALTTSNGLACGATFEEAALAALLELLERDAFMIAWQNRLELPRLELEGDRELERFLAEAVAPAGVRFDLVDLSRLHAVPTALALLWGGEHDLVALAVGAAAARTARQAAEKALCEAFATRAWARSLRLTRPEREFRRDFADIVTFEDHVHLYALHEHAARARFLAASPACVRVTEVPPLEGATVEECLTAVARRLADAEAEGYLVDVTPPDVAAAGLRTVRAIAPELCSLDVAHTARCLGGSRLYEAAWKLGLRDSPLAPGEVNPLPHPFP
jgi:ribosomal protein S12 methylthiotransferase accessory factor